MFGEWVIFQPDSDILDNDTRQQPVRKIQKELKISLLVTTSVHKEYTPYYFQTKQQE